MTGLVKYEDRLSQSFQILLKGGQIKRISPSVFLVKSQSQNDDREYKVQWAHRKWLCNCKAKEKQSCVHINSVMLFLSLPQIIMMNLDPENMECPRCGSSIDHTQRTGIQRNKSGMVQRFTCQCGYRFNDRSGFAKLKSNPATTVVVVDLYLRGMSSRQIAGHLHDVYGVSIDHTTVFRWTARYLNMLAMMEKKLIASNKIRVGERWLADEVMVKIRGKRAYIWSILDYKTRYLLATLVSRKRDRAAAERVIKLAVKRLGKVPRKVVSDGLKSYVPAIKNLKIKVDGKTREAPLHVAGNTFQDKVNNNRIERFNRTLRKRVRIGDKFEQIGSANDFVAGFGAYYNLLRPNMGLNKRTPAGKAMLDVPPSIRKFMLSSSRRIRELRGKKR